MGKKLIIKGADFSANALPVTDITNQFSFTDGKAFYHLSTGASIAYRATNVYKCSDLVDISAYAGKSMEITLTDYTSSSGTQTTYYDLAFLDAEELVISSRHVPIASETPGTYAVETLTLAIPTNAKYVVAAFFVDSYGETFACSIV